MKSPAALFGKARTAIVAKTKPLVAKATGATKSVLTKAKATIKSTAKKGSLSAIKKLAKSGKNKLQSCACVFN